MRYHLLGKGLNTLLIKVGDIVWIEYYLDCHYIKTLKFGALNTIDDANHSNYIPLIIPNTRLILPAVT